jgi:hypothetical protein
MRNLTEQGRRNMTDEENNAKAIAALNDCFRKRIGIPFFGVPPVAGTFVCTASIAALPPETQITIWFAVRDFEKFDEGNDPYAERDFGAIVLPGMQEKIFWKIDYFADSTCSTGAEDPSDAQGSFRLLTIMLASEY